MTDDCGFCDIEEIDRNDDLYFDVECNLVDAVIFRFVGCAKKMNKNDPLQFTYYSQFHQQVYTL